MVQQKVQKKISKETKSKQRKLRKIDLSEIKSQIGTVNRKPAAKTEEDEPATRSAKDAVKQTLARMDKKSKKKVYKKDKVALDAVESAGMDVLVFSQLLLPLFHS